jgi:hypothetical protein
MDAMKTKVSILKFVEKSARSAPSETHRQYEAICESGHFTAQEKTENFSSVLTAKTHFEILFTSQRIHKLNTVHNKGVKTMLEKIVKKMMIPMVVGAIALTSVYCKSPVSSTPQDQGLAGRQVEIAKPGSNSLSPKISFTYVPPIDNYSYVKGKVIRANPNEVSVVLYDLVRGTWWVKPYYSTPKSPVASDGTFSIDYVTGGVDEEATRINAYLVKNKYVPPGNSLPDMNDSLVLAGVTVDRN